MRSVRRSSFCTSRSPWRGVLPVGEADLLHDVVDVRDDALDDDVGVLALGLLEQLGQGFLGPVALLLGIGLLLGFDDVLGKFEDLPSGTPGW